jgi:uncharacterized membrane protein
MNRPRVKIELDISDWIIEIIGATFLVLMILYPLYYYNELPYTIPIHFNISGQADRFSHKSTLWALPAIGLVMYIGLWILNKYPHIFNYPTEITAENASRQYRKATKLIRTLNMLVAASFFYIVYAIIQTATNKQDGLGSYFLPVFLVAIFGTISIYLFQAFKENR